METHHFSETIIRLDSKTTTGHVRCQLPLTERKEQNFITGSRINGIAGSGAGHIKARVVTGHLIIESTPPPEKTPMEKPV